MVSAQELTEKYRGFAREGLLRKLNQEFRGRIAITSSFGTESWALLQIVANVDPEMLILFTNTGKIFRETLAYLEELSGLLGLVNVRTIGPSVETIEAIDNDGTLWETDNDKCCTVRKAIPFREALKHFNIDLYVSGRRRDHGGVRTNMSVFENDGLGHVRVNLIADMSTAELALGFKRSGLPPHPLVAEGFESVGCDSCTVRDVGRCGRLELGKPGGKKKLGECNFFPFEEMEAQG